MSNVKGSALAIIAIIIGAGGLGIGISSMIMEGPQGPPGLPGIDGENGLDGTDGIDGVNGTDGVNGVDGMNGTNVAAIWHGLSGEGITFNITLSDIQKNNSEYFYMSQGGNVTHLMKTGWYRFTLNLIIGGILSTDVYIISLYQNNALAQYFEHFVMPTHVDGFIHSTVYAYNDGDDHFSIYCESLLGDDFYVTSPGATVRQQFVIEWVGE